MAEQALQLKDTEGKKSKKRLYLVIAGIAGLAVLLAILGWYFFQGDKGAQTPAADVGPAAQPVADTSRDAFYVAMPRPFLFNLPGQPKNRLVEIKVQLMVRGADNDTLIKKHIPLIEDALLTTFSAGDVQALSTQAGKDALRQLALSNVQNTLHGLIGNRVVEKVLFTGFVMQ